MKSAIKVAALGVLLTLVAGCRHKKQPILPRQVQAPVVTAQPPANSSTLPAVPPPEKPDVSAPPAPEAPPPKPKHKRKSKPAPSKTEPAPEQQSTTPAPASNSAIPTANSPIGQLSTSSDIVGEENHSDTVKLIDSTEKGLDGITRALTPDEQKTATQIRAFLQKAKEALAANDLDGAHTLATKAKILLDELTK